MIIDNINYKCFLEYKKNVNLLSCSSCIAAASAVCYDWAQLRV